MAAKICTDCQYAFDKGMLHIYTCDWSIHRNKLILYTWQWKENGRKYKFCRRDFLVNFTLILIYNLSLLKEVVYTFYKHAFVEINIS
jgi:hypothetical protein